MSYLIKGNDSLKLTGSSYVCRLGMKQYVIINLYVTYYSGNKKNFCNNSDSGIRDNNLKKRETII